MYPRNHARLLICHHQPIQRGSAKWASHRARFYRSVPFRSIQVCDLWRLTYAGVAITFHPTHVPRRGSLRPERDGEAWPLLAPSRGPMECPSRRPAGREKKPSGKQLRPPDRGCRDAGLMRRQERRLDAGHDGGANPTARPARPSWTRHGPAEPAGGVRRTSASSRCRSRWSLPALYSFMSFPHLLQALRCVARHLLVLAPVLRPSRGADTFSGELHCPLIHPDLWHLLATRRTRGRSQFCGRVSAARGLA